MTRETTAQKSYEESCRVLAAKGLIYEPAPLPDRMPSYDDEQLGIRFFRTKLENEDLTGLSLPRAFFGRSLISGCRWAGSDLRASHFLRCRFARADLSSADLRRSSFVDCSFSGANVTGTRVTAEQTPQLRLDVEQGRSIIVEDEGDELGGG